MPALKRTTLAIAIIMILAVSWIGCSDDTIVSYIDTPTLNDQGAAVEVYFPLNEGYTTIYNVTYLNGGSEQVTFKASDKVRIDGIDAVIWVGSSSNSLDTGYFYAASNTLYYYSSVGADPEKILQLPLTSGTSWQTNDINSNDFTDIITNTDADTTGDPNINAKDFPTVSAVNFTVEQIEPIDLNSGSHYNNAVRISTPNGTRKNYYWYVEGIGLVRYVIGSSTTSYPEGDIVGELINYGY